MNFIGPATKPINKAIHSAALFPGLGFVNQLLTYIWPKSADVTGAFLLPGKGSV